MIVLTPGIGMKINGQRCWIKLPIAGQFQPSEFVKIPVVLMLARYFGKHRTGLLSWKESLMGAAILGLPIALILLEPDVGQAITYLPLLAVVLFLSSVRMWIVAAVLVACIGGAPLAYTVGVKTGLLHGYKLERINVILDPENADKRGFGYHTWQSMVTVGEGGLMGARGSEYSQSSLKFLPEPHTDFIFSVTAETTGFIGCLMLLASYALLLTRLITDARRSRDRTGMLVIMAIVGGLIFQIFINVGMALGFLPVIGVPLPLMSAGLSSVLAPSSQFGFAISATAKVCKLISISGMEERKRRRATAPAPFCVRRCAPTFADDARFLQLEDLSLELLDLLLLLLDRIEHGPQNRIASDHQIAGSGF